MVREARLVRAHPLAQSRLTLAMNSVGEKGLTTQSTAPMSKALAMSSSLPYPDADLHGNYS